MAKERPEGGVLKVVHKSLKSRKTRTSNKIFDPKPVFYEVSTAEIVDET